MEKKIEFSEIYKEYYGGVYNYIFVRIRNIEDSQEMTNDVFLKVHEHLNIFDPEKSKLITWIFNIAKNKLIDYYRKNNNRKTMLVDSIEQCTDIQYASSEDCTDSNVDRNKLKNDVDIAMSGLKGKLKTVAELYFMSGKKYIEIAEILDIPMNSVKVYILRAKEKLQCSLKEHYAMSI